MQKLSRRETLVSSAALAGTILARAARAASPPPPRQWKTIEPRDAIRERYFPDVVLRTEANRRVRLYEDLVKDKIVLLHFMYANCDRICPRVVHNLTTVYKLLGERAGKDVFLCSFTLDPAHDTPNALKKYAAMHQAGGPGWSFLTGSPATMEMLRRRLGFTDPDPVRDKDRENHIGNVRYGNEARCLWGACPGMSRPEFIVESLSWVDRPKA
jgi:protein SCO1/2